ncbi:hypothetical protein EON62_01560 [archaeon]|nr:MAG: hypothetical protein EON62_01560 [archaeon]
MVRPCVGCCGRPAGVRDTYAPSPSPHTACLCASCRQLNIYGFVKSKPGDSTLYMFYHPHFRRAHPELLTKIKRKKGGTPAPATMTSPAAASSVTSPAGHHPTIVTRSSLSGAGTGSVSAGTQPLGTQRPLTREYAIGLRSWRPRKGTSPRAPAAAHACCHASVHCVRVCGLLCAVSTPRPSLGRSMPPTFRATPPGNTSHYPTRATVQAASVPPTSAAPAPAPASAPAPFFAQGAPALSGLRAPPAIKPPSIIKGLDGGDDATAAADSQLLLSPNAAGATTAADADSVKQRLGSLEKTIAMQSAAIQWLNSRLRQAEAHSAAAVATFEGVLMHFYSELVASNVSTYLAHDESGRRVLRFRQEPQSLPLLADDNHSADALGANAARTGSEVRTDWDSEGGPVSLHAPAVHVAASRIGIPPRSPRSRNAG